MNSRSGEAACISLKRERSESSSSPVFSPNFKSAIMSAASCLMLALSSRCNMSRSIPAALWLSGMYICFSVCVALRRASISFALSSTISISGVIALLPIVARRVLAARDPPLAALSFSIRYGSARSSISFMICAANGPILLCSPISYLPLYASKSTSKTFLSLISPSLRRASIFSAYKSGEI